MNDPERGVLFFFFLFLFSKYEAKKNDQNRLDHLESVELSGRPVSVATRFIPKANQQSPSETFQSCAGQSQPCIGDMPVGLARILC